MPYYGEIHMVIIQFVPKTGLDIEQLVRIIVRVTTSISRNSKS